MPAQNSKQEQFRAYQLELLEQHERQQQTLHSRLMQNANVIVLTLSFIFLFEMTFIGGAFPDSPSTVDLSRYWPCLVLLVMANAALVLALALLLSAIVRFNAPWPTLDDYFPNSGLPLDVGGISLRYAIVHASEIVMIAQERVVRYAKTCVLVGVLLGAASAVAFMVCMWHGAMPAPWAFLAHPLGAVVGSAVFSALAAAVLYYKLTENVRSLYRRVDESAPDYAERRAEAIAAASDTTSNSDLTIVSLANDLQGAFARKSRFEWPHEFDTAWIVVNSTCRLGCRHCYARGSSKQSSDMSPSMLRDLIALAADVGTKRIMLTGGDALEYPHLERAAALAHERGMQVSVPTSGVALADARILDALVHADVDYVNLSLKGWDAASYKANTGYDGFEDAKQAMESLIDHGINVGVSMVLDAASVPVFLEGVRVAKEAGVSDFLVTPVFEPVSAAGQNPQMAAEEIKAFVGAFEECYDEFDELTCGRFRLEHTLPLCFWDKEFLEKLCNKGQFSYGACQLFTENGLVFDANGGLLPCNAFHAYPYGRYGREFSDAAGLRRFLACDDVRFAWQELASPPSQRCMACSLLAECAGGCATRWMRASFEEYEGCMRWKPVAIAYGL